MIRLTLLLAVFSTVCLGEASLRADQPTLGYYLPSGIDYDPAIPKPSDILGHEVGEWHVRHDLVVQYFEALAAASPRFAIEEYGRSHEGRRLLLATVTNDATPERIEALRTRHLDVAVGRKDLTDADPAVVWMGYGVHGNESSATNASVLLAYYLCAARGKGTQRLLDNCLVLIDPCINPDGLSRFAHWANTHKSRNLVGDPASREHNEVWPGGRTNHYWFDLNRDWLLLTHPESRGRLAQYHAWKPNVLTDYHEMGTNSTYFFQPGIPSRQNPLTPDRNLELTREIAKYHARALDGIGSLYYTEESFDDFYYGKGSTYPDINGAIGILFEQASSRGHLQESTNGPVSFPFTIRNQFATSLSTLAAAESLKSELLSFQRSFYDSGRQKAKRDPKRAYVFGQKEDHARNHELIDLLNRHGITVNSLARKIRKNGHAFDPGTAFVVELDQLQYWLIRACFETRTEFPDESFYDVSTWTLPLSFGVPYAALTREEFSAELLGDAVRDTQRAARIDDLDDKCVAAAFEWHGYYAPRSLSRLQSADVSTRAATRRFTATTARGPREFDYGTIVVQLGVDAKERGRIKKILAAVANEDGVEVHGITGGLTPEGVDLGSPSIAALEAPKPLLLVGSGVSSYEAGEVWHLLDTRYDVTLSKVESSQFNRLDLDRYTHVILVGGSYDDISEAGRESLSRWVRGGGVVVAMKSAAGWAAKNLLHRDSKPAKHAADDDHKDDHDDPPETTETAIPAYADYETERAKGLINGSIFEAVLDITHPICFGYVRDRLPVFRNSSTVMPVGKNRYGSPVRYTSEPLLSGYASDENVDKIAGSAAISIDRMRSGTVIRMVDNPNFRGVWYGTNKFFANALFFGGLIKNTARAVEEEIDSHGHEHTDAKGF